MLAVTATVDATGILQVSISGTDTAQIGSDATHQVVVKDSTNAIVFTGPAASTIAGIHVAPGGTSDIIDLRGVGATTDYSGLATITVDTAALATTFLSGSINTTGDQVYAPNVLVTGDTTLSTSAGAVGFGGVIEANGAPHALAINSFSGEVFSGDVGNVPGDELSSLSTSGAGVAVIKGGVMNAASLTFNDDVSLQASATLTATASVSFAKTLNTDGTPRDLTINSPSTTFSGQVGAAAGDQLGALATDAAGTTFINTDQINAATLDFNDDVVLQASTALTGTTAIAFAKTVNSNGTPRDLTLNSPSTSFGGEVGAAAGGQLGALTTDAAGTTTINTDQINAATLAFNDDVVLQTSTTLTGTTAISFGKTVNTDGTPRDLTLNSPSTTFNGRVGGTAGDQLGALATDASGTTFINTDQINAATLAFNDDVVLQASTTLTGTTAIAFAKTVNSNGTPRDLTLNSPSTTFNGEVGAAAGGQLGALTTDAAGTTTINTDQINGATLAFNDDVVLKASTTLSGTSAISFGKTVNTDGTPRDLTLNSPSTTFNGQVGGTAGDELGTLSTDAAGTTTINTNLINGATLAFNDDVVLKASATLTGTTAVSFGKTLNTDGTPRDLSIDSPSTTFKGSVGGTAGDELGTLTTDAAGTTFLSAPVIHAATLDFNDDVVFKASSSLQGTTAVTFHKTIDTDGVAHDLTVDSPNTNFLGQVGGIAGDELGTLTTDGVAPGVGTTTIATDVIHGASLAFDDDVVLAASTALRGTTSVAFAKTVNTDGTARDLTISSPSTTFGGEVGATAGDQLAALTIDGTTPGAGTTLINTDVISGATLAFNDDVVLKSSTTLTGTAAVSFAKTVNSDGTPRDLNINSPSTTFNGEVGTAAGGQLGALTTDATGTTFIHADALSATALDFEDDVVLQAATTLAGTASVKFAKTVNTDGTARDLTVHSPSAAFNGRVGATAGDELGALTTEGTSPGAGTTILNADMLNGATLAFNDDVVLKSSTTLTGSAAVSFAKTVNTDGTSHDLTIHSPSTTFSGRVGGAAGGAIGNLAVDGLTAGAGTTTFRVAGASPATPSVLTSANQTYGNAVVLGDNTVLSSSAGGTIAFQSTIDGDGAGPWSLTVDTSGDTLFGDGAGGDFIGKLHPLASLSTSGGGATKFNVLGSTAASPTVTTAGPQTYGDNVVLLADAVLISTVDNAPIVFQGTVDAAVAGGAALTVDATGGRPSGKFGVVQFNANVGTTALSSLTVLSGGPFTLAGGLTLTAQNGVQITVAEATPPAGGDDLIVNGAIQSLAGSIELDAADNLAINAPAQLTSPASVTLRGDFNNNDAPPGCTILLAGTINSPVTNVFGGAGNDTINVQKTTAGVTTIDAGAGDDTINVSSTAPAAGGLTSPIAAAVVVAGGAGADKLNVDDSGDAAANVSGALTSTSLSGLGLGAGITYSALEQVNVLLGSGANLSFNVKSTLATTPANVTGKGVGTVNVGDGNKLDGVLGTLGVSAVQNLNLNDQAATLGQTYDLTNAAVMRLSSPQVLVTYSSVGTLAVNGGAEDDAFNLFLPSKGQTPLTAKLMLDGGASPPGLHNKLSVIASQVPTATGFVYAAKVSGFGGPDPIQIQNVQSQYMYGAPKDSNDFANDTSVPSVMIGGQNVDTLLGGTGQDVLFGGGAPQTPADNPPGDQLLSGGVLGAPPSAQFQDFVFAEYSPVYQPGGGVTFQLNPGNGNTKIDAGGGSAVSVSPHTFINNATTVVQIDGTIDVVTWLRARFLGPEHVGLVFNDAAADPVFAALGPPATLPGSEPVAGGPAPPAPVVLLGNFVSAAYLDALGRAVDPASRSSWVAQLQAGAPRSTLANALTHSDEYYGNLVQQAYLHDLGRSADAAGLNFWIAQFRDHGLTDERLEASFIGSDEYFLHAGGTNLAWVDHMYMDILGRPADAAGESFWVGQLNAGAQRADVAYGFTASLEREQQRVEYDYIHYLGRVPDAAGVDFWVNQFAHGETNENLVAGFLASQEYYDNHSF